MKKRHALVTRGNHHPTIYVQSFGCPQSRADGQVVGGCLSQAGYGIVDSPREADILIYMTCAVKEPTENRVINLLRHASKEKKLVVAGCLPLINEGRVRREIAYDALIGPAPGKGIVEVVARVSRGERVEMLQMGNLPPCDLPKLKRNRVVEILPISYGCLDKCSYCSVKLARGNLRSYSIKDVVNAVRKAVLEGAKEVWLTAQDTGAYGMDLGCNLAQLLNRVSMVPGRFRVRVGMMNPTWSLRTLDKLIEAYRSRKIYKFLHLPVQSGSDPILKAMRRRYRVEDFLRIVGEFRAAHPRLTLATDVIVGFPGETEEDFERTLNLMSEVRPDIINISKYAPRPGTEAAGMKRIDTKRVKQRSRRLTEVAGEVGGERNVSWLGWEGVVLIDERGARGGYIGRNFAYKPIVVKSDRNILGKFVRVRVTDAETTYLRGELHA
ncbi:MAG: tRNA (N(6)-L-threonylcarbamoyladenosine(37)-C(2))-methylthiotransferase [Candidatus Geothermarchaeales archaeon]